MCQFCYREPELVVPLETSKKKNKKKKPKATTSAATAVKTESVESTDDIEPNVVDNEGQSEETTPIVSEETSTGKKSKKKQKSVIEKVSNTELNDASISTESNTKDVEKKPESSIDVSLNNSSTTEGKKKARRKKKKKQLGDNAQGVNPSQSVAIQNGVNGVASGEKNMNLQNKEVAERKVNLKRKLDPKDASNEVQPKKKKKNNKQKQNTLQNGGNKNQAKNNNKFKKNVNKSESDNPLSKLTDERLKAYGLNPKKYRSFLKYKKF